MLYNTDKSLENNTSRTGKSQRVEPFTKSKDESLNSWRSLDYETSGIINQPISSGSLSMSSPTAGGLQ